MDDYVNIEGLNKAEVLAALYNASQPRGMGIIHFTPEDMTTEEAQALLNQHQERQDAINKARLIADVPAITTPAYFDYLKGRVMKIRMEDNLFVGLYDRDNGLGAARRALVKAGLIQE